MMMASRPERTSSMVAWPRVITEPRPVSRALRARAAHDLAAGRVVRAGDDIEQGVGADLRVVDHRQAGVDDLTQVVRRDVGGHADGDAAGAVDQQVGETGRQDDRLAFLAVVVVLEVDRVLVDVGQQRHGRVAHAALGVAHGRGHIAVDRAEVALTVDQQQTHRERLGHAGQGEIDRLVAVRVEAAEHVADHAGALRIGPVGGHLLIVHRIEDAPVHGLEAVAHVGQRPTDDDAHRIVEIGAFQLVFDRDGGDAGASALGGCVDRVVLQGIGTFRRGNRTESPPC
jgi:hypothetical protein